jgi:hypothetical protein
MFYELVLHYNEANIQVAGSESKEGLKRTRDGKGVFLFLLRMYPKGIATSQT